MQLVVCNLYAVEKVVLRCKKLGNHWSNKPNELKGNINWKTYTPNAYLLVGEQAKTSYPPWSEGSAGGKSQIKSLYLKAVEQSITVPLTSLGCKNTIFHVIWIYSCTQPKLKEKCIKINDNMALGIISNIYHLSLVFVNYAPLLWKLHCFKILPRKYFNCWC